MTPAPVIPLAVTMGDPAGIGLDIVLDAYAQGAAPPFRLYGCASTLAARARALGVEVTITRVDADATDVPPSGRALPVIDIPVAVPVRPGRPDPANAPAVIAAIERAVADVSRGAASAVVTCPIAKATLAAAGFPHPGHTEFLADLAARHTPGRRFVPVMMIASDTLKVVPLTIHIPLARVPAALNEQLIVETARIVAHDLAQRFGLPRPRIAVAGLNPHAGESGTLGREEIEIIAPAIRRLAADGIDIRGPLSADTMFHAAARSGYDVALAMYHDQALIPIKTLAFDSGVNVTLGLPFVRTSPDHGTAFDIAASGRANPSSYIAALHLAARMAARDGSPV